MDKNVIGNGFYIHIVKVLFIVLFVNCKESIERTPLFLVVLTNGKNLNGLANMKIVNNTKILLISGY